MHYPFPFICLSYVKYETSKSFFSSSSLRFRFCFVSLILPSHVLKQAVLSFLSLTHRNGIFQAIWLPVFVSWEFFRINHTEAQSPVFLYHPGDDSIPRIIVPHYQIKLKHLMYFRHYYQLHLDNLPRCLLYLFLQTHKWILPWLFSFPDEF